MLWAFQVHRKGLRVRDLGWGSIGLEGVQDSLMAGFILLFDNLCMRSFHSLVSKRAQEILYSRYKYSGFSHHGAGKADA